MHILEWEKARIFHKKLTTSSGEGEVCISLIGKKSLHLGENNFPIFSFKSHSIPEAANEVRIEGKVVVYLLREE